MSEHIKTLDLSCNALRADACCAFAQVMSRHFLFPVSLVAMYLVQIITSAVGLTYASHHSVCINTYHR
jgi:hypothetical protein